jgi:hypothetical protein
LKNKFRRVMVKCDYSNARGITICFLPFSGFRVWRGHITVTGDQFSGFGDADAAGGASEAGFE